MTKEIWKRLFWCGVVAAVWCLSMIHSENNGYKRGYDDGHNIGIEAGLAKCAEAGAGAGGGGGGLR